MNKFNVYGGSLFLRALDQAHFKYSNTKLQWISPLSIVSAPLADEVTEKLKGEYAQDIKKQFSEYLKQNPSEYFIVEVSSVRIELIKVGDTYFTYEPKLEQSLKDNDIAYEVIKSVEIDSEAIKEMAQTFAEIILQHYKPQNIILVSCKNPSFFLKENIIAEVSTSKFSEFIELYEQTLFDALRPNCIRLTGRYFVDCTADNLNLNMYRYEEEFVVDVNNKIRDIVDDPSDDVKLYDRSDDTFNVIRAARHLGAFYKKALHCFLEYNDNATELILGLNRELINKYTPVLSEICNKGFSYDEILSKIEKKVDEEFYSVCSQIIDILKYKKLDYTKEYSFIFDNDLKFINIIIKCLTEDYKNVISDFFSKTIIKEYAGYYYNIMRLYMANSITVEQLRNMVDIEPLKSHVVDVFGSCVSREILNYDETIVNHAYIYHACSLNHKVKSNHDELLKRFDTTTEMSWDERCLYAQIADQIEKTYTDSVSDFLIMDLWQLTTKCVYQDGEDFFTCVKEARANKFLFDLPHYTLLEKFTVDEIKQRIIPFLDFIRSRYGKKIILISTWLTQYFINNDKLYLLPEAPIAQKCNENLRAVEGFVVDYLNCYYIDLTKHFMSDDLCPIRAAIMHYEPCCYAEEARIVRMIIENMPEQKYYSEYSNETRLRRIARLCDKNRNSPILKMYFKDNFLDDYVFNMTSEDIISNLDILKDIYDRKFADIDSVRQWLVQNGHDNVCSFLK